MNLESLEACKRVSVNLESLEACREVSVSLGCLDTCKRAPVSMASLFEVYHEVRFAHTPAATGANNRETTSESNIEHSTRRCPPENKTCSSMNGKRN